MNMKNNMRRAIIAAMCVSLTVAQVAAEEPGSAIPDLTKGGELTRINERWAGPLGIFCGMWRARQRSDDQMYIKQLLVQKVDKGSPADGILFEGDVILGADGTGAEEVPLFEGAPWTMIPIAEAITEAEARDPAILKLLVWRPISKEAVSSQGGGKGNEKPAALDDLLDLDDSKAKTGGTLGGFKPTIIDNPAGGKVGGEVEGKVHTISIQLESLGRYSDTAPFNCLKSQRILRKGIQALYESNQSDKAGFGVLCLLAADDPTNPENAKYQAKAKEWVYALEPGGSPWFSGPKLMALAEYYMKTKDQGIFPKLAEQAEYHAKGVSWFGTAGHRWSEKRPDGGDNGRIAGYGPITCSGALGFLGLTLARSAGVQSPAVEASNNAQRIFFGHYAFRGGMGYGEHAYGIGGSGGDYNGKAAMSGLALGLFESDQDKAKFFTRGATLASYSKRQYAHGGCFFGQVWHPIGAIQGGVKAANLQFKEIRWHLDLKRRWDNTRIYDSSGNDYGDFAHAATALIFYAAPLKQLYITGRGHRPSLQFTDAEFAEVLETKSFDPKNSTTRELLAALPRCYGMLRTRAGGEIARRIKETPDSPEWPVVIDQLLAYAANGNAPSIGRAGACYTLMMIKDRSPASVAAMKNPEIAKTMVGLLKDPEAYIRFAGVRVLQRLNPEVVRPHVNEILDAVVATGRPTFPLNEEDPLQWAHGEMGALLFKRVLNNGVEGIDRNRLLPAIRSLLKTPNGSARSASTTILSKLTKDDTLQLADVIIDNIQVSPPGNAMFAGQAALNSQAVLARHMFEEALPLSAQYGPADAIKNNIPQKYGKAALNMQSARQFLQTLGDQILVEAIDAVAVVEGIEKGAMPDKLYRLKRIDGIQAAEPTLKLPANQTQLLLDATNFARRGETETTYTWRKVFGAGKVSFSPNASGQSKGTKVTFLDKKPGTYRFEVEMSDTLGINVIRETVDVTLSDPSGKLPRNTPPTAISQSLEATPGLPLPITLSGTDPDGDDLGFVVTKQPSHGELSGVSGNLIYTAFYRNPELHPRAGKKETGKPEPGEPTLKSLDILGESDSGGDSILGDLGLKPDDSETVDTSWTDSFSFEAIDGQGKTSVGTVNLRVSDDNVGVAVYEGFDYPQGAVYGQEGRTSFGFSRPWNGSRGKDTTYWVQQKPMQITDTDPSFSYPSLPSKGGRLTGQGHTSAHRYLDPEVLAAHKLLDPGQELWFSVFVQGAGGHGWMKYGFKGSGVDLGFRVHGYGIYASYMGENVGHARNPWSRSAPLRFEEKGPNMIVGRCTWGKTDADTDKLEIYRVFVAPTYGPLVLDKPACVFEESIPQEKIRSIYLEMGSEQAADEIRIGPTQHSVMLGTKQLAAKVE